MDGILILLAISYALGLPAAVIYLLVANSGLARRVRALEADMPRPAQGVTGPRPQPTPQAEPQKTSADVLAPLDPDTPFDPAAPSTRPPPPAETPEPQGPVDPPPPIEQDAVPAAFVLRKEKAAALAAWMRDNWFFAVAALSLGLAGVFFVQYGIEQGLLTPTMRVAGAVGLGLILIGAAEWLRRRGGDEEGDPLAFLPSTFAAAGLVSIFAGIVAARQLYGLIDPALAFIALAATGAGAVLMGWFYGAFLTAAGLLGATMAPFVVGGSADEPYWLYAYFAVVSAVGLAVDAARRWAWISTLALVLGFGAAQLLSLVAGGGVYHLVFAFAVAIAAIVLPPWSTIPRHGGVTTTESLIRLLSNASRVWPEFPTRLAAGAAVGLSGVAVWSAGDDPLTFLTVAGALLTFLVLAAVWMRTAPALTDLAALPVVTFWAMLGWAALDRWQIWRDFTNWAPETPDAAPPMVVAWLVVGALGGSAIAGWRSLAPAPYTVLWAFGAALIAPLSLILFEVFWEPAQIIGGYAWALHAVAGAALMTGLAVASRRDPQTPALQLAVFVMAALTLMSLAAVVMFSKAALTVALVTTVLACALLDRRFDLPQLAGFLIAGILVTGWRLVIDPGIDWAFRANLAEVLLAYGGAIAAFAVSLIAVRVRDRTRQVVYLESALWVACGTFATILIQRMVDAIAPLNGADTFWNVSLVGTVWLLVALGQVYRMRLGPPLRWLRIAMACFAGLVALFLYGVATLPLNPAFGVFGGRAIIGPWVLNTLLIGYAIPAAILLGAPRLIPDLNRWLALGLRVLGAAFAVLYVGLAIRHIWRGPRLDVPGITDPELYSYTVAMLLTAAALMVVAWIRKSPTLRRVAIVAVGVTIAKVFLVDMSGLTGLIRVVSFLALGLSLAGLALLNRWMTQSLGDAEEIADPKG